MEYSLKNINHKRILLSPLNWGMGHLTRTVPIIRQLIAQENKVFLCCDLEQQDFYKQENLSVEYIQHEGYPFHFTGIGIWELELLRRLPSLIKFVRWEKKQVSYYVEKFKIDLVISDQRYGFYSPNVPSIFISHQLMIPVGRGNILAQCWNYKMLKKFNRYWVPDDEGLLLSGKLSNNPKLKREFIGVQSRFTFAFEKEVTYRFLGIVSGPMPYALNFAKLLQDKLLATNESCVLVVPKVVAQHLNVSNHSLLRLVVQPATSALEKLFNTSEIVVSRAGYSTLMDLTILKKKAILIPTKGQNEQLYLSEYHDSNHDWRFFRERQFKKLDLNEAVYLW